MTKSNSFPYNIPSPDNNSPDSVHCAVLVIIWTMKHQLTFPVSTAITNKIRPRMSVFLQRSNRWWGLVPWLMSFVRVPRWNMVHVITLIVRHCLTRLNWAKNIINLLSFFLPNTKGCPSNPQLEAVAQSLLIVFSRGESKRGMFGQLRSELWLGRLI